MISFAPIDSLQYDAVLEILKSHKERIKDFERFGLAWSESQIKSSLSANNSQNINFGLFESDHNDNKNLLSFILGRNIQDTFEIDIMMTSRDHLNKGLMEKLFKEMLDFFKVRGFLKEVWLEVHEENRPATEFYKKMGFRENARRPKYYPDGKAAILMTLSV